ncbi:MAG TPA: hypothetical protein VD963_04185 [Phycisphaerales bacterium]|nr:hypothetical protein [Phycisphaerales bacterium]
MLVSRLAAALGVACLLGTVAAGAWHGRWTDAGLGAGVVLVAGVLGIVALARLARRPALLGAAIMVCSGVRTLGGLAAALGAWFAFRPDPGTYLTGFLTSALVALAAESAIAMRWVARVFGRPGGDMPARCLT